MGKNYIIINGKSSRDFPNLLIEELPPMQLPEKKVEVIEVEGMSGNLTITDDCYLGMDKSVNCKGLTTLRNTVRPDFQILFNDKFYWIEYNGIQHYKYLPKLFHKEGLCKFIDQIDRDNFIKEYCSNNKIICIVIPYLYDTYNEIAEILESCIIQEIPPESIIKYPEINLIESN